MVVSTFEDLLVDFLALGVPNLEHILVVDGCIQVGVELVDLLLDGWAHLQQDRAVLHPLIIVAGTLQCVQLYIPVYYYLLNRNGEKRRLTPQVDLVSAVLEEFLRGTGTWLEALLGVRCLIVILDYREGGVSTSVS
jgi:hypothetical protein